jgi:type IV fimbrial biogenesis protein FimT
MMTAIFIMAILVGLAVPSFREASLSSKLSGFANDIVASTQLARSEAIKRNAPVTLCASSNGTTCASSGNWRMGWIVTLADGTVLQRQQALPSEFRITQGTFGAITFPATVVGVTPATFTVCRASPVGRQERVVTVTASGSASVRTTETGSCS